MLTLWPWQQYALQESLRLINLGATRICIVSPTGMGKGKMIEGLALHYLEQAKRVILFTNRRLLTRQTGDRFTASGINFGYVSASHGMDTYKSMLVASVQTVASRVRSNRMELPQADCLLVDEAHNCAFDNILEEYRKRFPSIILLGFTASPINVAGKYDHMILAGSKEDGRMHNALVPCRVYAPSEPDMGGVKMNKIGEYSVKGMAKRVMQCTVFSDVFDSWKKHGGQNRPTILWAPGVPESRWFVQKFREMGINAEHIDGQTDESERERICAGSKDGSIQVVSSFGVLREGIDWPWLSYGILVQVCGGIGTFVQTVGRLLRYYPGKVDAILQDHSGTWWRHGSPNDDIEWSLESTNQKHAKERKEKLQRDELKEPVCCPNCGGIRTAGPKCPHCGYEHTRSVRMVRMVSGQLVRMAGSVVKRKPDITEDQRHWSSALYRCGATGRTLNQAFGLCSSTLGHAPIGVTPWPSRGDWDKPVSEVFHWFRRHRGRPKTNIKQLIRREACES